MSPSDVLINKSEMFWNLGVNTFNSRAEAEGTRLDVVANRLYYGMFLAVCAYACRHRGLKVEEENPNVHRVAKALVQEVANMHREFLDCLSAYDKLAAVRVVADYDDVHVESAKLTPDKVIKPANKIRIAFMAAAKDSVDQFNDVVVDLSKVS